MSAPWLRNSAAQAGSGGASVWSEHVANDNRVYYWNSETKTSSWEKPDVLKTAEERTGGSAANGNGTSTTAEKVEDWKEYETPEGKKYYHNHGTGVTTWDKPEVLVTHERDQKEAGERSAQDKGRRLEDADFDEETQQELERLDRINVVGSDGKAISAAMYALSDDAVPLFKTTELAEEAFTKMLRKVGVQTDWSWEQAMRAAIKDPVWRALPSSLARKAAFEQYIIDVKKATVGKQKDRVEKLKRDFDLMMRRHDEIKSYSQWKNVKANLEGEVAYKAAIDDEERETLFNIYIEQLHEREMKEEKESQKNAMVAFVDLLRSLEIGLTTTWKQAQATVRSSDAHASTPQLRDMRKVDALLAFEQHIVRLDKKRISEFKIAKAMQRRDARRSRKAFSDLLAGLRSAGKISAGTKWKNALSFFKDSPEFLNLVGQSGSSPMDLYWDICDEMEGELRDQKVMVLDVLDAKREVVTLQTDFEAFTALLQSDNRTSHMSEQTLRAIYEQFQGRARKKADEERKVEERRLRRKQDDLRAAMKKLEPPIGIDDTYDAVRIRISMLAEFTSLETEASREAAFDKYIRRLKERIEEDEQRAARRDRHSHRHSPVRERRHERDRRSSRDSRRSGGDERDGHDPRRRHRSERRASMEYDPRSPKRPKHDPRAVELGTTKQDDEPMLDYGEAPTRATNETDSGRRQSNGNHAEGVTSTGHDSSEDGEIAE